MPAKMLSLGIAGDGLKCNGHYGYDALCACDAHRVCGLTKR